MTRIHDALVIGGGPTGSAVAQLLAAAGREVILAERTSGPHDKVCGEFLSHAAVHYLCRLGVEPVALGAVAIDEVGLARHRGMVNSKLPFRALSLSRRRLDEALIERAGAAGAEVLRGRNVSRLETGAGAWSARLADGEVLRARDVFIATGKHELRGWKRPISSRNDLIGMKVHFRLTGSQTAELDRRVELVLFPGGYGGLEPIEQGMANLCLLVRKRRFAELGHSWPNLLAAIRRGCPHLDGRLRGAEPVQHRPLTIASIPYGFVRSSTGACWHLGDQAAVIPSFAGQGVSIALHSAHLAAASYLEGEAPDRFQRRLAGQLRAQIRRTTLLSHFLVQGWAQRVLYAAASLQPVAIAKAADTTSLTSVVGVACAGVSTSN